MPKPIEVTLHDPKSQGPKTYTRSIVPWGIMKRAMRLVKNANLNDPSESDLDEMTGLVVALFGDQFTAADVENGLDINDMSGILEAIIGRAMNAVPDKPENPTTAA